jgi:hypothetical protein
MILNRFYKNQNIVFIEELRNGYKRMVGTDDFIE